MNAIKNITIGHTERLYTPVGYTMLANLVNIVPFCLSIEAIRIIFNAFDGSGQPLDTTRLWWIFGVMVVYMLVMALAFGLFQALMPFIGWMFAKTFSHLIESVDHWIAFAILAFLGGRMILESFKDEDCRQTFNPASPKVVFTMAIATSIDALAIGISFALLGINNYTEILSPILIIGFVSFVMSLIGLYFGIKCGCGCARKLKAELWGGIILVAIGLKILIEHLFLQ